jgi:hypothetical protein
VLQGFYYARPLPLQDWLHTPLTPP